MFFIADEVIDKLIAEDIPYFDLTTWALGIRQEEGIIEYFTREEMVLCGTEEVLRIFERFHIKALDFKPSGESIQPGEVFIRGTGGAQDLLMAWKVCQNILDHCSGIATKTKKMLNMAKRVNPDIMIVTTRKGFPGVKPLMMKSILTGGAFPHRLGVSESVLIFKQHMNFMGGKEGFIKEIPNLKIKLCEKKLIVEAESIEDGIAFCRAGAEGIQFDKLSPKELGLGVQRIKKEFPHAALLAAGGVNEKNVEMYAATGVDAIVTTSLYNAPPIDIGVKIHP